MTTTEADRPLLPGPAEPYDSALRLAKFAGLIGQPIKHWRGEFYQHTGSHWQVYDNTSVRVLVYALLHGREYCDAKGAVRPWKPSAGSVSQIVDALRSVTNDADASTEQADNAIPVANGWLVPGSRELREHTPDRFNLYASTVAYVEDAPRPVEWHKFLDVVFPDADSQALLQEWFGYVLSGRADLHKIMFIKGPPRSGKSTIAEVLQGLVGTGGYAGLSLTSFASNFGLQNLIGRSLAVIGDARMSTANDQVTERLLSISGQDDVQIDIKHREPFTGRLSTRIMMLSNEIPVLRDAANALSGRFLLLEMTQSFLGREDPLLRSKLAGELSGILSWALDGYDRLAERHAFTVPPASAGLADDVRRATSPVREFLDDECVIGDGLAVETGVLFGRYVTWCGRNNVPVPPAQRFGVMLMAAEPSVRRSGQRRERGVRVRDYMGVGLDDG